MPSSRSSPSDGEGTGREKLSNESQHLAQGTEVARLRRRFSFFLQQALLFRTRYHLCKQGVALPGTRQLRSQGLVPVYAHRTEGVTVSRGREGANRVGGGIGVRGGNGEGNGVEVGKRDVNVDGDGDGDGAGTRTGVEVNEGTHDRNEEWSGDSAGPGTMTGADTRGRKQDRNGDESGDRKESSCGDGNGDEDGNGDGNDDGNENGIGQGVEKAKKHKKRLKSFRRDVCLFRTRHHLCRQRVAFAVTRQLRSQGQVSVHARRTEGVTGSKGREETNRLGNIIEVGGGNGDGNTDGGRNREVNGDGDGAGTRTAV